MKPFTNEFSGESDHLEIKVNSIASFKSIKNHLKLLCLIVNPRLDKKYGLIGNLGIGSQATVDKYFKINSKRSIKDDTLAIKKYILPS